ncbi:putative hydrolase of the HAD superfamily [Orbus hercynius]|uniref:Putative hydrolase of the HAD superfamily n=1 Tax=Orbus hercynius TaxID=593135 RepID=A0A495RK05_9GAMM|nr:5-amino-6-(5-phospho-D-ribitylamino)uracil phosphatase YigB [Orbus hercynius]RKS87661.1 putative hydrolase of the HAD superfamily [Orbus hercynius]
MHVYRSLNPIKALTFDLDDTLYDNGPYLAQAVDQMMAAITQVDGLNNVQLAQYNQVKQGILTEQPDIYHDVFTWRAESIRQLLRLNGIKDSTMVEKITDQAMDHFVFWRNKVVVPKASLDVLAGLAEKYPLAVITNGNADIEKIGLAPYFQFSLRGGADGLSKPYPDMFQLATSKFGIAADNIMHVGDHLEADVQGAINGGMQACWINLAKVDIYQHTQARVLPHIEINQLSELNNLL